MPRLSDVELLQQCTHEWYTLVRDDTYLGSEEKWAQLHLMFTLAHKIPPHNYLLREAKFPAGDPNAQTYIEFDGTTNLFYHRYDDGIEERRNGDPEYVKYWEKPADILWKECRSDNPVAHYHTLNNRYENLVRGRNQPTRWIGEHRYMQLPGKGTYYLLKLARGTLDFTDGREHIYVSPPPGHSQSSLSHRKAGIYWKGRLNNAV